MKLKKAQIVSQLISKTIQVSLEGIKTETLFHGWLKYLLVTLLKNMAQLKQEKDTCDVILRVKKGNFYWASFWAHKSVLSAYSPVFAESLKKFQT